MLLWIVPLSLHTRQVPSASCSKTQRTKPATIIRSWGGFACSQRKHERRAEKLPSRQAKVILVGLVLRDPLQTDSTPLDYSINGNEYVAQVDATARGSAPGTEALSVMPLDPKFRKNRVK